MIIYLSIFVFSLLINLAVLIYFQRGVNKSFAGFWFSTILVLGIITGLSQVLIATSSSQAVFDRWNSIYQISLCLIPPVLVSFALTFVGKELLLRKWYFVGALFAPAVFFIYLYLRTDLLTLHSITQALTTPWGIVAKNNPIAQIVGVYFLIYVLIVNGVLYSYQRLLTSQQKKQQIFVVMMAFSAPALIGLLFGIIPLLTKIPEFPSIIPSITLMGLVIAYAFKKYGLATFDPYAKLAEKEEQLRNFGIRFQKVLDNLAEGCQIISPEYRYVYVNSVWAKQGKHSATELINHTIMEIYPGIEKTPVFAEIKRCMEQGTTSRLENEFVFPDGSHGWFELHIQRIPEGVFILSVDITENKKNERYFQTLFENSLDVIYILDSNLKVKFITPSVSNVLGYLPEEFSQLKIDDITYPEDLSLVHKSLKDLLAQPGSSVGPVYERVRCKNGTWIWLELVGRNLLNVAGVEGLIITARDATKRKQMDDYLHSEKLSIENQVHQRTEQLFETQARLESSINSLNVGFVMTDPHENIFLINDTAKRLICLTEDEHGSRAFHKDDLDKLECTFSDIEKRFAGVFNVKEEIAKCLSEQKPIDVKSLAVGSQFFHLYMAPIVDLRRGKINTLGVVILVEDITEAKVLERSRDEFFSIASHELRTPLTAIRGNSSMIQQFYMKEIKDQDMKDMLNDIHDSAVRLINIVNDFLDTSRLEQGRMEFKRQNFDVRELTKEVFGELTAGAVQTNNSMKVADYDHLTLVLADHDRVKQVLFNLIGNALKYTENGSVTVSFAEQNGSLKTSVSDTGKGIPLESQSLLFRKFQQASNSILTRDNTRSTGLGLYISRLMVEGMGGKIWLEKSELDKGTTFTFTLPLALTKDASEVVQSQVGNLMN